MISLLLVMQRACLCYYIIITYYYVIITPGSIITHYYQFQSSELADECWKWVICHFKNDRARRGTLCTASFYETCSCLPKQVTY